MRTGIIVMALTAILASPAIAQGGPPRYDVDASCNRMMEAVGESEFLRAGCFQQEQKAYDTLKARWAQIPEAARVWCQDMTETVGRSYFLLLGCVEQEERAAAENTERTFRY